MHEIRTVAVTCIGRAVLFGSLAIGCVMVAFSFNPVSSFRAGAVLTLLMAAILLGNAWGAGRRNPRHTEVWLYLDDRSRPANAEAVFLFATVLREVYANFGRIALIVACAFYLVSILLVLLGFQPLDEVMRRT